MMKMIVDVDGCKHNLDLQRFSFSAPLTTSVRLYFDNGDHVTVSKREYERLIPAIANRNNPDSV